MPDIEAGFIVIDNIRLEYRSIATDTSDAATLVFLHEGLGSVAMWKDLPEQVHAATAVNAFIYSRQSYGKSSALPVARDARYLHHEALDVLPKVLEAAEIQKPVLIGHSDGASIALIYASSGKLPRASALVLMAPHVFNEDLSVSSIALARQAYEQTDLRERLGVYHDNVDNTFWRWNDIWLHDDFRDWNIEEYLSRITIPVLHIQGENDEYGTDAQVRAIQTQCAGPVEVLLLDKCKHTPFRDQPQATLEGIRNFIRQHT